MENLYKLLMMTPHPYGDTPNSQDILTHYLETIQRRNAGPFRNVGPNNLMQVPDRNMFLEDDLMRYRNTVPPPENT